MLWGKLLASQENMGEPPRLSEIQLPWELRKAIPSQSWKWQRGCFDRLLRSDENLEDKWIYVQDNPVRAGLVRKAEDWPFYLDFINDSGKLAASPTKAEEA
jgi:hypothetical protein